MSTLADSLVSSSSRPLAVRRRLDISAREQQYQGQAYWVLKDPLRLKYYRLEPEEYWLWQQLDGTLSLAELCERFEAKFRPQRLSLAELQQFLSSLHAHNLVLSDAPEQGAALLERQREGARRARTERLTNVLAIRFQGIDPDRLLQWLYPRVSWMFSRAALLLAALLVFAALLLVVVQFDAFQSKLPAFHDFFAARNWIYLAMALAVTKVLHEFGHALTCTHFGGECHEMGVLLLVLTPCLYCNVSDSWMLPSKWQRAAIGAAGMMVELVLAAIATFLWWFSEPGLLNYLCLSVMFVSSVSTLLFNANPLMRYDGYYILSDLVEIPNLRQKASTILHRKLGSWCLGLREPEDPFLPKRKRALFALYSIAAAVYRWVITLSILWFLHKVFEPYRLEIIGQAIAVLALYSLIGRPLWQVIKFFSVTGRIYQVKRARMAVTVCALAGAIAAVMLVPLPSPVFCTIELQARDAASVYVDVPGVLRAVHVTPGQHVQAGAPLAVLENADLRLRLEELHGQQAILEARYESLLQQRFRDDQAGAALAQVSQSLASLKEQLREKQMQLDRLQLIAPTQGTILPPKSVDPPSRDEEELPSWAGTPLEAKNVGALLPESTLFCQVGDPRRLQAVLVIEQGDIPRVRVGQDVELRLESRPGEVFHTTVQEIAHRNLTVASKRLSQKSGGDLVTRSDAAGRERPQSTNYQAVAYLAEASDDMRPGLCGEAKIHAPPETLARRLGRYLSRTFRFDL